MIMKTRYWVLIFFVVLSLNAVSQVVLFSPSARQWVQAKVSSQQPEILSVVEGDLLNDGSRIKVVKFRTVEGIVLEFYSDGAYGSRYQKSRVVLPNAKDGFFTYRGQAVQLAITDLDGDGTMELVSPTFDEQLVAHLNPYRYSHEQQGFVPFFFSDSYR